MIVVPENTWDIDTIYLRLIRERYDYFGTLYFTVCIKDSGGNVVLTRTIAYDTQNEPDVAVRYIDIGGLRDGVYMMDVVSGLSCSYENSLIPVPVYTYLIHKTSSYGAVLFQGSGWNYRDLKSTGVLAMYVYNGKLFWIYKNNVTALPVPKDVPIYIEYATSNMQGFVGVVTVRDRHVRVDPNVNIPFYAEFEIKINKPKAMELIDRMRYMVGLMSGASIRVVNDYTFSIVIAKTEPGLSWIAGLVLLGIVGISSLAVTKVVSDWRDVEVSHVNLKVKVLEIVEPVVAVATDAWRRYVEEVEQCAKDDLDCVQRAQYKWFPLAQGASALAGKVVSVGVSDGVSDRMRTRCSGLNIGGVCVPWWVVAVAIFLAGLLVISVVRR
jgi:hypothetical protein